MPRPRASNSPEKGRVPLNRALSKLGILSRARATEAIAAGRVSVDGRVVTRPDQRVAPERVRMALDGVEVRPAPWRAILLNKPKGVVTTGRDPEGRRTVYDVLGEAGRGLVAVGRLDLATSGLLLLTTDTRLAGWITDPTNAVPRLYTATVRGRVDGRDVARLLAGFGDRSSRIAAHDVRLLKSSGRESHLLIELREGRYREVRRLCEQVGHEVTRLKRIRLGLLELADVPPGQWREVSRAEIEKSFPGAPIPRSRVGETRRGAIRRAGRGRP